MIRRFVKWILIVVGLLFGLAVLAIFSPWSLEMFFHVVIGWIPFLKNVVPKIGVSWDGVGMLAVCLVLAGALGHGFCRWLWRGTGHEAPWRPRWTIAGLAVVVLMFAAGMAFTGVAHQTGWLIRSPEPLMQRGGGNERNASISLKTIASAQADFRANDRDCNHKNEFWRADIAGLYALAPEPGQPIKLIELSVAAADDRPLTDIKPFANPGPKGGYWIRALRHRDEQELDPNRFAAITFPTGSSAGKWMYVIDEENSVFRKEFTGQVPEFYPNEAELNASWEKLD